MNLALGRGFSASTIHYILPTPEKTLEKQMQVCLFLNSVGFFVVVTVVGFFPLYGSDRV